MKKSICLYFQVHQPTRLRLYRFFEIGKDSHYFDDFANRTIVRRIAERCYLPANAMLLDMINASNGQFKVAFSISGSVLEQFDRHCPEVIESFKKLVDTGCVELLAETYNHSLVSLASPIGFKMQVEKHKEIIQKYFGVTPVTFRNTELIYSDAIGAQVYEMGFKTMLTEGAKHVLGWRSPNYVYNGATAPKLKLLLRNSALSDDIAFRFSDRSWNNWPLTCDKYLAWLNANEGEIVNLFMDYETFGEHQRAESGIFEFMKNLAPTVLADGGWEFVTPAQAAKKHASIGDMDVEDPISWADEERDTSAWLGNELQQDAYNKLYGLVEKLGLVNDEDLWQEHSHLQESDHLYYMCTKFFSDGSVHKYFNPYDTPYEAFINYMNVLSDFTIRLDDAIKTGVTKKEKDEEVVIVTPINRPVDKVKKNPVRKSTAAKAPAKKASAKKPAAKK
ncbi:MAG: glycoside hydrolase family 57 protein [Bacteroidales bacterium]|nr:glycoside hydrolase family 57 protein [Candidatus Cryptobacteroides caccocaballi]